MAEAGKKKPRKSKLVLRECIEIEDESNSSTQMQEPAYEASQTLLPKLKNSINNDTYNEKSPSPVQFSIQIDVESCFYEEDVSQDAQIAEIDIEELNLSLPSHEVVISNERILEEVDKLSSTQQSYSDKRIQVAIRNYFGKYIIPHVPDYYETKIQEVLIEWKLWYSQSKIRGLILAFKCNICSVGWWYLEPFHEHIRVHKEISLSIETCNHECCIVASQGEWFETMCLCKIEGNCPQCLKSYEQHSNRKHRNTFYYHCEGCNDRFTTCSALFAHEGECIRYEKIIFKTAIPTESMWKCDICNILCLSQDRYKQHYSLLHCVRSDNPSYFPSMKSCTHCPNRYHIYAYHACPAKPENIKCNYCHRKFLNRTFAEIHMKNTKKDIYCRICHRYLKSQCMESDHLLKHSRNYIQVMKCNDCRDNVLLSDLDIFRKHRTKVHLKRFDKRRDFNPLIVPRSCMMVTSDVTVNDMIIVDKNKTQNKSTTLGDHLKKFTETVIKTEPIDETVKRNSSNEIIIRTNGNLKLSDLDKERIDKISELNKILQPKRSINAQSKNNELFKCYSASQSNNDELFNAIEGLKNDDTNENTIKEEEEDVFVTDEDIKETQNSVDALLSFVANKDDVQIEEPKWACIVIDDTDEDEIQDGNSQASVDKNKHEYQDVDLSLVKKEPGVEMEHSEENSESENNLMTTDVTIKEEKEDYEEEDVDVESDIKKEHDACLEELSKVFRASKDAKSLKLTGISLAEEVDIKDEPMDDEYEEDIIMLCTDRTRFDVTALGDIVNKENEQKTTTSDMSKEITSDMDLSQFEPDLNIKSEPSQSDTNTKEPSNVELTDKDEPKSSSSDETAKVKRKLYKCKRCQWIGNHKAFAEHKMSVCVRKKQKKPRIYTLQPDIWREIMCTKCDTSFINMKAYFSHFTTHRLKPNRCPRCNKYCYSAVSARHLTSHIKNSFLKLQVLKGNTTTMTSKSTGVYQCKTCQNKVEYKDFFEHWERHLDLNSLKFKEAVSNQSSQDSSEEERALSTLVVACDEEGNKQRASNFQLSPEELKMALEQMQAPADKSSNCDQDKEKRCMLCRRHFSRRNDVKRHIVEHLLRDAQSRVPALVCQLCEFRTNKADVYKTHMRNHAALPVFKCELCNKWFSDSSNFAKHKKVHNVNVLSSCELCGRKFNKKISLEKHMEMHATTEPVKCEECDKTFYTPSAYNKHMKAKHERTGLNRYCRICLTRFSTMRAMWTHMWDVHKERRCKADCPICGKPFRKQQDVREHLRDVHFVYKMRLQPVLQAYKPKRAPRSTENDIESFLQNHNEIEIGDDGEETLVIYEEDLDADDL
ncbi:hypothetical protein O0L34_g15868 [Tuta absoluta]|nr:hypothetical protein O0L34_g15868 [Tuta absoluta]